jgi:acetyl esterase/lipase
VKLNRIAVMFVALALQASAVAAQAAPGTPPQFKFELATKPSMPGVVLLDTGPSGNPPEQWFLMNGELQVRNVDRATLTPFLPAKDKATGAAVIVAPGGGFLGLAIEEEGFKIARALADRGIAAFVLKYRVLPTPADLTVFGDEMIAGRTGRPSSIQPPKDTPPNALADGQAAIVYVRAHAKELGVDPNRVGMMGFSAGAFTTLTVMRTAGPHARPDFIAPIYGRQYAFDIPANAPPMFNLIAADDFLWGMGTGLIDAYRKAGKSVEFHLLPSGGHGFGIGKPGTPTENWMNLFFRWMELQGLTKPKRQ